MSTCNYFVIVENRLDVYIFCQAFTSSWNGWLLNTNSAFFSDVTQNHHPLIWKVLLYKNHHLQFEFLLNVQECSMVVNVLEHLPWQHLNADQYSFWVFHHIRISFFASISFAASSGFAMFSKKTFVRKTTFILLCCQHVLEWEWIWSVLTNSKKSGSFSSSGNCAFSVFSLKST